MDEPLDVTMTRLAYDTVAASYHELLRDHLAKKVYDRAVLSAFAEQIRGSGNHSVLDAGCGPGRITAHLAAAGLEVRGMDLSPAMIAVAQNAYPSIGFAVGSLEALEADAGSLGGIVAWYSLIHTPPERRAAVLRSLAQALVPGGLLLLAFQVGDAERHIDRAYGHDVSMDAYLLDPGHLGALLEEAGCGVQARLIREPDSDERTPQAYLVARKK
jgi:SAM-dependent methyltransferase